MLVDDRFKWQTIDLADRSSFFKFLVMGHKIKVCTMSQLNRFVTWRFWKDPCVFVWFFRAASARTANFSTRSPSWHLKKLMWTVGFYSSSRDSSWIIWFPVSSGPVGYFQMQPGSPSLPNLFFFCDRWTDSTEGFHQRSFLVYYGTSELDTDASYFPCFDYCFFWTQDRYLMKFSNIVYLIDVIELSVIWLYAVLQLVVFNS